MKRYVLIALLGGFALSASAQEATPEILVRGYQIELPAKPITMFKGDFEPYVGGYDLSNGETMTLRKQGRRMFARIGDREPSEIVAASRGVFVALDRNLKLSLDRRDGEVRGELLMVRESLQAGQAPQVIRLAAR